MPALKATLNSLDLDLLNRIARSWGIELLQTKVQAAVEELITVMLDRAHVKAAIETLTPAAAEAWQALIASSGVMPWSLFTRNFGEVRDFGPARRERENPDRAPVSAAETLWYAGLIGRAFLDISSEPQEYAYVPDELLGYFSPVEKTRFLPEIRPAVNQKPKHVLRAGSRLLDHLTDLLAAARMGREVPEGVYREWRIPRLYLQLFLKERGLLDENDSPNPEVLKEFFQQDRVENLSAFLRTWRDSTRINDLRLLPGLSFEGAWENDPRSPRHLLVDWLVQLDPDTWWSISSLVARIKQVEPDFQRPAGDYDSWFIRDTLASEYLRGFAHWDKVEGALLIHLVTGPLHWLGLLDIACSSQVGEGVAFRVTPLGRSLLTEGITPPAIPESGEIKVLGATTLVIPHLVPRVTRYQVARFCEFVSEASRKSAYRITPESLAKAAEQGLTVAQLMQILEKNNKKPVESTLKNLLERWNSRGLESRILPSVLLKFEDEVACGQFLELPGAAANVVEVLNPQTVVILDSRVEAVQKLLAEMGVLVKIEQSV